MSTFDDIVSPQTGTSHGQGARAFAALSLLAANLGFLALFVVFDLTLFELVVVYWLELLWIGLFSGLKLVTASLFGSPYENRWVEVSTGAAILMSLVAIAKSAGLFFTLLFAAGMGLLLANEALTGVPPGVFVESEALLLLKCSLLFLIGHALSFVINFVVLAEFRHARVVPLLWLPFKRSIALLAIVASGLLAIVNWPALFSATSFALVLIVIKLCADWFLHRRERSTFA